MKISYLSAKGWLMLVCYAIMSGYVVYKQATDLHAITLQRQEVRHERMLAGDSEFFNPWQYRIFSTYVVEGFYQLLNTVSSRIDHTQAFLLFRFLQNLLIFYIAHLYFSALKIKNPWLILCGILLMGFFMAHSVFQSDLSFNTYFDVLFYLLAGWLILTKKIIWIIPLMLLAALNRETSLLIPAMLVVPAIQWNNYKIPKTEFRIGAASVLVFFMVFISVRWYYGYPASEGINGMKTFTDYLYFNLRYMRIYPELTGTLAFLPIVVILFLKRLPLLLRQWFWIICPAWFAIHLAYSTAVETRLFLVPQVLIFIPAFLWLIEHWYHHQPVHASTETDV